ncbi:MAG: Mov34/MPN/PAD-1 family protein [Candidatus Riflebacteria bacterium]|nr:Mov34/MPN/PAD-1 family protein [Candidatus Riflebacteria bacterium]
MSRDKKKPSSPPNVQAVDFLMAADLPETINCPFPAPQISEYRVRIDKSAYEKIVLHSNENKKVELCGVLTGKIGKDNLGPFLLIDDMVRAEGAKNEGAQVTFTHTSWDFIHNEIEKRGGGKIVGWYHTHPGFGIFLSDMDKFIQEYFFNQPFQVAFVIDPISNSEGLFAWISGKIQPLSKWWVGETEKKLVQGGVGNDSGKFLTDIEILPKKEATSLKFSKSDYWGAAFFVTAFCLGIIFSLFFQRLMMETAFKEIARSEMRTLFASTGGAIGESADLGGIKSCLDAASEILATDASGSVIPDPQRIISSARGKLVQTSELLASMTKIVADRESKLLSTISGQLSDPITLYQKASFLSEEITQIKNFLAEIYFLETRFAVQSASQEPNKKGLEKAQIYRKISITLNPLIEERFKSEFPGLSE